MRRINRGGENERQTGREGHREGREGGTEGGGGSGREVQLGSLTCSYKGLTDLITTAMRSNTD